MKHDPDDAEQVAAGRQVLEIVREQSRALVGQSGDALRRAAAGSTP